LVSAIGEGSVHISATLGALSGQSTLVVGPPDAADFDVAFIERTPRFDYDAPKNNPAVGDAVTFLGHIKNWGRPAASVDYQWQLDGRAVSSGSLAGLKADSETVVKWPWKWQSGAHRIKLVVDPNRRIAESSEANNQIEDRTDGLSVGFWVEQSVYDFFHAHQRDLKIGSNSWEDWAQRQMSRWNEYSRQAIYPLTPNGVPDRVRIDKIVVVPDGALPLNGGLPSNNPDTRDKSVDLMWGFNIGLLRDGFYANTRKPAPGQSNPFYYEPSLVHELGHARYLIDQYGFDVANNADATQVQIEENGRPVAGTPSMPFVNFNAILYYNQFGGVMSGPFGGNDNPWSPYEAAALNQIAGHRAQCGNQNAPCNIGVFLGDLPARNHFHFVDSSGAPMAGAQISLYQPKSGTGIYGKTFDNTPEARFTTDAQGNIEVGHNPFAPGQMQMIVLRISHGGQVWYRFVEACEFNVEFWRGHKADASYTIELPDAKSAPLLEVRGYEQPISNNDATPSLENHTDFGMAALPTSSAADGATQAAVGTIRVFVLKNRGGMPLKLQAAHINGANAGDFTIVRQIGGALSSETITTLQIQFNPQAIGVRRAVVTIPSENGAPFSFAIQGNGVN